MFEDTTFQGQGRKSGLWAAMFVVCVIAGCAHYQSQPLSPERNAAEFEARSLTDVGLRTFLRTNGMVGDWPPDSWDLNTLTVAAFYYHPDLDLARARYRTAGAGRITAGQRPNPTLTFTPRLNSTSLGTDMYPWIWGGLLDIPIETFGKRTYRMEQAQHLQEISRFELANVAWQVRSRVRRGLLGLQGALASEQIILQQMQALSQVAQLAERQWEAGAISPVELTSARVTYQQAQLNLKEAQRQAVDYRAQLAEAVGVPTAAVQDLKIIFPDLSSFPTNLTSAEIQRLAVLNRADVLGSLAEYAASESALHLQIAKQYPDIHLRPGYELDQEKDKWTLGLAFDLPVLNQNQGPIAEAKARREEAAAKFNSVQTRAIGEIERTRGGYSAAIDQAATAEGILTSLQKRTNAFGQMFAAGEVDKLALTSAQAEFLTGSLAQLNARIKTHQALAALEDAVQHPLLLKVKPEHLETSARKPEKQ